MISTPSPATVADAPRPLGRPTTDDIEAATPAGRAAHKLEHALYTVAAICLTSRERRSRWQAFDATADATVRDNESVGRALQRHPDPLVQMFGARIVRNCDDYWDADAQEDAEVSLKDRALDLIHAIIRRVCAWIERAVARSRA